VKVKKDPPLSVSLRVLPVISIPLLLSPAASGLRLVP
jgi:hypothetical protein